MSQVTQKWSRQGDNLCLSMHVTVNGEQFSVTTAMNTNLLGIGPPTPPIKYIERDMRRRLMAAIEEKLFEGAP